MQRSRPFRVTDASTTKQRGPIDVEVYPSEAASSPLHAKFMSLNALDLASSHEEICNAHLQGFRTPDKKWGSLVESHPKQAAATQEP